MDLSAIKPQSKTFDVVHPATDEPTGLKITIIPQSDPKVQSVQRRITNARLAKRKLKLTSEQIEEDATEMLAASVVGLEWTGEASFNGEQLECTPDNVRALLEQSWIKEQVDNELGAQETFFTA